MTAGSEGGEAWWVKLAKTAAVKVKEIEHDRE